MTTYIIRRLLSLIPLFLGVVILSYTLMLMAPGGPAGSVSANPRMTQEMKEAWLDRWCVDDIVVSDEAPLAAAALEHGGWGVVGRERVDTGTALHLTRAAQCRVSTSPSR